MAGKISGVAVAGIGLGAAFLYAAIKGKSVLSTLQSVIRGQNPATAASSSPGSTTAAAAASASAAPGPGGTPPAANVALGRLMAAAYGWGAGQQWAYLRTGWQEESGWRTNAANVPSDAYNHAYGIPQANPGTKMAEAGPGWKTDPATQIKWGLNYIRQAYGSPVQVPGWSASGPLPGYTGY